MHQLHFKHMYDVSMNHFHNSLQLHRKIVTNYKNILHKMFETRATSQIILLSWCSDSYGKVTY